jgi:hypothetical protein
LASAWNKEYPLIRHDAYTDSGSSGGILVNLFGEWIGVHSLSGVDEEFGLAVPMDYLYELLEGSYYSLLCDWESYWTDSFTWQNELSRARESFDRGLEAQDGSKEQADAWRESLKIVKNIRFFPSMYEPLFPELFHLPGLFVRKTDVLIAYYSYHLGASEGRLVFSQDERNRLWESVERAKYQYITEYNSVQAVVEPEYTYKASSP